MGCTLSFLHVLLLRTDRGVGKRPGNFTSKAFLTNSLLGLSKSDHFFLYMCFVGRPAKFAFYLYHLRAARSFSHALCFRTAREVGKGLVMLHPGIFHRLLRLTHSRGE